MSTPAKSRVFRAPLKREIPRSFPPAFRGAGVDVSSATQISEGKEGPMKNLVLTSAAASALFSAAASAGVVAFSSFEELAAIPGQYVDTLDPATDHALLDNLDQPFVNYAGGAELGFSSFYTNTRNDVGLSDGDFLGVTNFTGTVGAFTDGVNGFQLSDTDGLVTVTMQGVDLTGLGSAGVSIDLFVQATGYEADDRVRVWVEVDGGVELDLFALGGDDLESPDVAGQWLNLSLDLTGYTSAVLRFELDSNAGTEAIFVDNIVFVPAPGAVALLGLAGLAGTRRRRG